ncbi:hypothetical protein AB0K40_00470 [Nonomuraea bangladeshensis]|uniref:GntR family transcriptional regulator n=1 Tax=Nonomuraea bangladeshensis TaxID=404385 RepID=A0ABV3GUL8_9ACTN
MSRPDDKHAIAGWKVVRALRADGLIRTEPGVGNFVTKPEERKEIDAPQEAHAVTLRWSAIIQWY